MDNFINWEKNPLIPVIVQNIKDSKVLMLAYANKESFELSLKNGLAYYFSRSKKRIWKKGEESGNFQIIKKVYIDCDRDTILFIVEQNGVACHTGNLSCFFQEIKQENIKKLDSLNNVNLAKNLPYSAIDKLYHILQDRKSQSDDSSYTAFLYQKGENGIGKKIAEEAAEFAFSLKDNNENEIIHECADLIYHILVGLSYRDISPDRVMQELENRFGLSGLEEKRNRNNKSKS